MRKRVIVATCVLALAGCGANEPSEAEMKEAVLHYMRAFAGGHADKVVSDYKMKKLACSKVDKSFKCDYEMMGLPASGRFVKADDGWRVVAP